MNFINKNKKKIIMAVTLLLILIFAFWFGNGTKESRGFSLKKQNETATQMESSGAAEEQQGENNETQGRTSELSENSQSSSNNELENESTSDTEMDSQELEDHTTISSDENGQREQEVSVESSGDKSETIPTVGSQTASCTFSISCAIILNNMDQLKSDKKSLVPEDGWILKPITIEFTQGESVYDVLSRVCQNQKIHLDASYTPGYNSAYVKAINNLYERDCGPLSGWIYKVNGEKVGVGASSYKLNNGDVVSWHYTCNMGKDL